MKIGVSITTYNAEHYLKDLYNSLPLNKIDELVIVNGGDPYKDEYSAKWIQHTKNEYPGKSRNDGLEYLISKNIDHFFLFEDDMIVKSSDIFEKYIDANKQTNLHYFSFPSTSYYSGIPNARTPKLQIQYSKTCSINFYPHMCNDFAYMSKTLIKKLDSLYIAELPTGITGFDVELTYRISLTGLASKFWWFADVANSDDLIMNNPRTISRMLGKKNYDEIRNEFFNIFYKKYGFHIVQIPQTSQEDFIKFIKERIKNEN
jgi:glycosyltransferase involved in cell wall biosynthesis